MSQWAAAAAAFLFYGSWPQPSLVKHWHLRAEETKCRAEEEKHVRCSSMAAEPLHGSPAGRCSLQECDGVSDRAPRGRGSACGTLLRSGGQHAWWGAWMGCE